MSQTYTNDYENGFRRYLSRTFLTVAAGVGLSAVLALISSKLAPYFIFRFPGLYLVITIACFAIELGIAFYFSGRLNRMSKNTAWTCYTLYSAITGLTFATVIMQYSTASITLAFVATSIMFACMAIIGMTSKVDYTKLYSLLLPAVIAGAIMSLLNVLIFHQAWIDMSIVYLGLILFLGITAADVKKLSSYYYASNSNSELEEKLMIMSAFQLYLDFVNLFIRILRILGNTRKSDR